MVHAAVSGNTKPTPRLPVILRSGQDLLKQGISDPFTEHLLVNNLPISLEGTTYNAAQAVRWLDSEHFAVGRWDGSLTVFKFSESKSKGPLITVAASNPSSEGVQMITWIAPGTFAASDTDASVAIWSPNATWDRLNLVTLLNYDSAFGAANSGEAFISEGTLYLVIGHENGFITIWQGDHNGDNLSLKQAVDVRNSHPKNPFGLHNIRGVATVKTNNHTPFVVSGSEDGDLCVINPVDGSVISRTTYNPAAQRGINAISVYGTNLLVANCAVGDADKNLWYYTIDPDNWQITYRDSMNLRINAQKPQVFNFSVIWAVYKEGPCFFSSTEEGALWMGVVNDEFQLSIIGRQEGISTLGAALAFANNGNLVYVAHDLHEYNTCITLSDQSNLDADPQLIM